MNTSTLPAARSVITFAAEAMHGAPETSAPRYFERNGSKVLLMENVALFRSGTFRDSIGEQMTWEPADIEEFVRNFEYLRSSGIFPDVPVRVGHPQFGVSSARNVIGYITSLRAATKAAKDGKEYTWLVGDYEILDPDAQVRVANGLYRNRSAEIGIYVDNNEVMHAPVFMGVAIVDIPAVERLNEFTNHQAQGDPNLAYIYYTEETMGNLVTPPTANGAVQQQQQPAPVAPAPAAPEAPAATFSIGGTTTSDPAVVQNYISNLESQVQSLRAAETARVMAERENFVNSLAEGQDARISAADLPRQLAFARGLNQEQWEIWRATMEALPANPMFANHAGTTSTAPVAPVVAPETQVDAELAVARDIVLTLHRANVDQEQIMATDQYKKLIAREPGFTFPARVSSL